jgi:hypothetical protein
MDGVTKLCNWAGQKADPSGWACPVAGSGLTLTVTTAGTAYTQTVVPGKRYIIVSNGVGVMWFSVTGVTSTAANRERVLPKNGRVGIEIPNGITTLHFGADTSLSIGYMSEVQSVPTGV